MKYLTVFPIFLFFFLSNAQAQPSVSLLSQFSYSEGANDVWGYAANGREYALVGLMNGVSIVDVTAPTNPVQVDSIPGINSLWRDLKTHNNFAYITNESGDGILVIDLTNLPGPVTSQYYAPIVNGAPLTSAHNLYIDEFGFIYLSGASNGIIVLDANQNAWNPPIVGFGANVYSHDVYVRNNIMYSSEIYAGQFAAYDVSDKSNITYLGSHDTYAKFTHNAWLSDDGKTVFTTDERTDAPIGVYDVSDFNNIELVLDFFSPSTIGKAATPHNVHVTNDYLVISYYSEGVIVVDASRPHNLVEIGQFKPGPINCWGAYPFLPSGNVLASDLQNNLYVIGVNYERGCYLEGIVTDSDTGLPIDAADVSSFQATVTNVTGNYALGTPTPGNYSMTVSSPGYQPKTINNIALTNGQLTQVDVELDPITSGTIDIQPQQYNLSVNPNPSNDLFMVDFELAKSVKDAKLLVTNVVGQTIETIDISSQTTNNLQIGKELGTGIYWFQIVSPTSKSQPLKVVKVN